LVPEWQSPAELSQEIGAPEQKLVTLQLAKPREGKERLAMQTNSSSSSVALLMMAPFEMATRPRSYLRRHEEYKQGRGKTEDPL
jgi:hypothetical protein